MTWEYRVSAVHSNRLFPRGCLLHTLSSAWKNAKPKYNKLLASVLLHVENEGKRKNGRPWVSALKPALALWATGKLPSVLPSERNCTDLISQWSCWFIFKLQEIIVTFLIFISVLELDSMIELVSWIYYQTVQNSSTTDKNQRLPTFSLPSDCSWLCIGCISKKQMPKTVVPEMKVTAVWYWTV